MKFTLLMENGEHRSLSSFEEYRVDEILEHVRYFLNGCGFSVDNIEFNTEVGE